jgi:hypothetical protein
MAEKMSIAAFPAFQRQKDWTAQALWGKIKSG